MPRYSSKGTLISWGGTTITNLFSLDTGVTRDQIDMTALEDTFRVFVGAIPDGGTVNLQGWMDPDHALIPVFEADIAADTEKAVVITFSQSPGAPTVGFNARLTAVNYGANEGQGLRFTLAMKATGARTFAP